MASFPILINARDISELERAALLIEQLQAKEPHRDVGDLAKNIWSIVATARHAQQEAA